LWGGVIGITLTSISYNLSFFAESFPIIIIILVLIVLVLIVLLMVLVPPDLR
jgi:hypothetical protein